MYAGKPIIGVAGGIGSGKSTIAACFADVGCFVVDSDAMVREAYKDAKVKATLKKWWGDLIFDPNGEIDRPAVWRKVVDHPTDRRRLEQLVHPIVNEARERLMKQKAEDPQVVAFVWDTPLLFETGLNVHCDAVVFVQAPHDARVQRVAQKRGWTEAELAEREKLQMPLDKKREISDYVIVNTADQNSVCGQVREVLSRILAGSTAKPSSP